MDIEGTTKATDDTELEAPPPPLELLVDIATALLALRFATSAPPLMAHSSRLQTHYAFELTGRAMWVVGANAGTGLGLRVWALFPILHSSHFSPFCSFSSFPILSAADCWCPVQIFWWSVLFMSKLSNVHAGTEKVKRFCPRTFVWVLWEHIHSVG